MSKHTPGPWRADENHGCKEIKGRKSPGRQGQYQTEICYTPGLHDDDEDMANAWLIAAAPDLLEALRTLATEAVDSVEYGDWPELQEAVDAARAAIKKAKAA